jgi:hypothetical protein
MPRVARGRRGSRAWRRSAAATLTGPARHSTPMTRLRNVAMTCGPLPVRTLQASSARVTSRMWCRPRCPSGHGGSRPGGTGQAWGGGEAGDGVHGDGAPAAAVQGPGAVGDPQGLAGVGGVEPGDGGRLELAGLDAAVAAVAVWSAMGDVWPRQELELVVERGLVGLHAQQVVGVLVGDQPVGVLALGVERVGGDDGGPRSKRSSSGRNRAISLAVWSTWVCARTAPEVWSIAASRWTGRGVVVAAAAQGLAVDGDRSRWLPWRWPAGR